MLNADQILFRASSMGKLMTSDRKGTGLGETAIKELIKIYARQVHSRKEEIKSKYLKKGNEREEDSITLLSRIDKTFYQKNDKRLTNIYFTGEPDSFIGESIEKAEETLDTKSSWSLFTFLEAKNAKTINDDYEYQGHVYMALTGAKKHTIAYCLVNGTADQIMVEKKKLLWELGETDPEFKEKCKQIEINHIFDLESFVKENPCFDLDNNPAEWTYDIPMADRIHKVTFDRSEETILSMIDRVVLCRNYMNQNLFKL